MSRVSIKITGAQGQGVNSVGEVVAKGLKRSGYCVFGYREYMSLIKGGHSSYQLDVSGQELRSSETQVDVLVCFNHHGLEENLYEVKKGGVVLHQTGDWKFSKKDREWIRKRKIKVIYLPVEEMLRELRFPAILGNMLITSVVWALIGRPPKGLKDLIVEQFGHKGEKIVNMNYRCIQAGTKFKKTSAARVHVSLPRSKAKWKDAMLLTGSQALGLGIVHAGCRVYVGYPMTPSSPLLTYIASIQNKTNMVIKQAEDEITAAQMMSGAMHMGTRAMTATSGGGFDLMTETLSLNGIIENPSVFGLAMRPGPATGLPTWTAQGDLHLAVFGGHGEYARCVIGVSDSQDAFDLMPVAFNIAEEFQISVIVLYDKQIAEAIYCQPQYDQKKAQVKRGSQLVTKPEKLAKLKATDRFKTTTSTGVSPRWLPGSKADTYCAQGDEHDAEGLVNEHADNAIAQMDKRLRKMDALKAALPEPELYGARSPETLIVGWGSTKGPILDVMDLWKTENLKARGRGPSTALRMTQKVGYLHFPYLWPLGVEKFKKLAKKAKKIVLVEGNAQGQLGMLLQQEACVPIKHKILKYDGRPFFVDELQQLLSPHVR